MILDGIICSSRHALGNLSPLVAKSVMSLENDTILSFRPRGLINIWVKMVVPPFATLFSNAA